MKRLALLSLMTISLLSAFSQKIDKAKDLLTKGKLVDAVLEIDKFLAIDKNKNNPDAIYLKGKILVAISKDNSASDFIPNAKDSALFLIKQYLETEKKQKDSTKRNLAMLMDNNQLIFELYREFTGLGASTFQAGKYQDASDNFIKSLDVLNVLISNKMIANVFDTTTHLYVGIAAEKAGNKDVAAKYYSLIADRAIVSDGFVEIYKWLADYYNRKEDIASASKYLNQGRKAYPADSFWDAFDLEMLGEKGTKEQLFKKYDEIIAKFPQNHLYPFNYAVELYQLGYNPDNTKRPANSVELMKSAMAQVRKSIEINPSYANSQMLLGQMIYNEGVDFNTINKTIRPQGGVKLKPEELKKKDELRKLMTAKFDESLPYFEKVEQLLDVQGKLKMEDKQILKDAFDLMITIYENKAKPEKVTEYTDKFNSVDKKHSK